MSGFRTIIVQLPSAWISVQNSDDYNICEGKKNCQTNIPMPSQKKFTIEPYSTGVCRGCDMDDRCEVSKPHFKTQSNGTVARGGDEEKRWGFVSMAYCVKPANNGEPILHSGG